MNMNILFYSHLLFQIIIFSWSDRRHKLCLDFVVLAVPMILADFPPYAKGRCPLKVNVKCCESYQKLSNLHEITHFYRYNSHVFAVTRKTMLYLAKNRKFKMFPFQIQWEFASSVPFSSAVGRVSAVTE